MSPAANVRIQSQPGTSPVLIQVQISIDSLSNLMYVLYSFFSICNIIYIEREPQIDRKVDPQEKCIRNRFYLFGDHYVLYFAYT